MQRSHRPLRPETFAERSDADLYCAIQKARIALTAELDGLKADLPRERPGRVRRATALYFRLRSANDAAERRLASSPDE